eukprot:GDKI01024694.1.p1 GENE.GDKI01024694.1~~GDKI01024694.1.p1  ORF type:complete len:175 (-),score=25.96 GDKI01024694.1:79-603(-)
MLEYLGFAGEKGGGVKFSPALSHSGYNVSVDGRKVVSVNPCGHYMWAMSEDTCVCGAGGKWSFQMTNFTECQTFVGLVPTVAGLTGTHYNIGYLFSLYSNVLYKYTPGGEASTQSNQVIQNGVTCTLCLSDSGVLTLTNENTGESANMSGVNIAPNTYRWAFGMSEAGPTLTVV